jgi:plastocyanin
MGLFRSGALDTHEVFRFPKPGTFRLTCSSHPQMVVTVIVE